MSRPVVPANGNEQRSFARLERVGGRIGVDEDEQHSLQVASKSSPAASGPMTGPQAERRYGVEIESRKQLYGLQRVEEAYGMQVAEWAQEGMPIETMGTPSQMEAFRDRKGTPVPWNVEEHNEQSVQRSTEAAADTTPAGDAGVPESVRDVISSPGQSLDVSIQRAMEQRMGDSFGDVRVHAGPTAARACEQIDARAFTVGNHVAFDSGEYDPNSPEGQHVLAHELAHVRQQTGGAVSMLTQEDVELEIDPDPALEREAEETAQRVMRGEKSGVRHFRGTSVHFQRMARWSNLPDRDDVADPLKTFEEMGLSEELLEELKRTVDADRYGDFFEDVWRIGVSDKDVGGKIGEVGEILSSHPEKDVADNFVDNYDERDELVVVPRYDNCATGYEVYTEENPEIDKIIMNSETGDVLKVVEEKTASNCPASEAVKDAEDFLDDVQRGGIPRDEDGTPRIADPGEFNDYVRDLSEEDFENAQPCAIVAKGMDDSEEDGETRPDQVATYRWSPDELKLLYKIVRDVRQW